MENRFYKNDLVQDIVTRSGEKRSVVENVVRYFQESLCAALQSGKSVVLTGFGTFKVVERKEHIAHNPANGNKLTIPAKKVVTFKRSKSFNDTLN